MSTEQDNNAAILKASESLASRYVLSCIIALVGYDYLLTFSREVALIWGRKVSLSTVLFFLIRYPAGGLVLFELILKPTTRHCDEIMKFLFALQIVARAAILVVFIVRTYAISHARGSILIMLCILALGILVLECAQEGPLSCFNTSHSVISQHAWAVASAGSRFGFDLIVACITIYRTIEVIRLPGRLKNLERRSTTNLVLGNGLFYFLMASLAELSVVIVAALPEVSAKEIVDPLPLQLACILISRFLLSLRERHNVDQSTLSTSYQSATLRFVGERAHSAITEDFGEPIFIGKVTVVQGTFGTDIELGMYRE